MDNRRQDYRLVLPPDVPVRATFQPVEFGEPFTGRIVDLSLGGMAVQLNPGTVLDPRAIWLAQFKLPGNDLPVVEAKVADARLLAPQSVCGFRFLPLPGPAANAQLEKLLWRFLLDEQRRQRRRLRGAIRYTG